jgi:hypothetical protein
MQWTLTTEQDVAVLSVSGYLPEQDADRLAGAVGWACEHSSGPLILDLMKLRDRSSAGQSALGGAVRGWVADGRKVVARPAASALVVTDADLTAVDQYPERAAAAAAMLAPLELE